MQSVIGDWARRADYREDNIVSLIALVGFNACDFKVFKGAYLHVTGEDLGEKRFLGREVGDYRYFSEVYALLY